LRFKKGFANLSYNGHRDNLLQDYFNKQLLVFQAIKHGIPLSNQGPQSTYQLRVKDFSLLISLQLSECLLPLVVQPARVYTCYNTSLYFFNGTTGAGIKNHRPVMFKQP
jgi:hypothetical protein